MPVAMVISPHADDASLFCGATLAKYAAQSWKILLVRVTDDRKASLELSIEETVRRNREELHAAAQILGVSEIIELGFEMDMLADVPLGKLREQLVYLFRKHRPYAVFSFDPFGLYEGNQDHIRVAQAVEEAYWAACFDKQYPLQFDEGLEPFSVCERWYFARHLACPNHAEDITETMEAKICAVCAQREMMRNTLNQYRLQIKTWGRQMPCLEQSIDGDLHPMIALVLRQQGKAVARQFDLGEGRMGESFRLVRFGELEGLVQELSEPLPVKRARQDPPASTSLWAAGQLEDIFPGDAARLQRQMEARRDATPGEKPERKESHSNS